MSSRPHFHFITLFPDTIEVWLKTSILGRAHSQGLFDFTLHQLRDFATDRYRSVDDAAYGGGGGMVLKVEVLVAAVERVKETIGPDAKSTVIYFSPAGRRLDTALVESLSHPEPHHYIFVCGHYEGADQRFIDHWVDLEVSLGDIVLTGGELPAVALTDAMIRRLDGTLTGDAHRRESFSLADASGARLLEYPHYTRPAEFRGHRVPEVLIGGDHAKVAQWRSDESRRRTEQRRSDLLNRT